MGSFDVGDARLHYAEDGTGRPVVFVHGFGHSSRCFAPARAGVAAEGRRALAVDLRAHGRSDPALRGHTVAAYARDLRALLGGLDLDGAVVVGHSLGASVIYAYVEQFGTERLGGVVAIGQGPTDYAWPDWPHGSTTFDLLRLIVTLPQEDMAAAGPAFVASLTKEPRPPDELEAALEDLLRVPPAVASTILFDAIVADYRAVIPKIDVPTLVCVGRHDPYTPPPVGEWLVDALPAGRLVLFEDSGHCPFLEEPDHFDDVLAGFLDEVSPLSP